MKKTLLIGLVTIGATEQRNSHEILLCKKYYPKALRICGENFDSDLDLIECRKTADKYWGESKPHTGNPQNGQRLRQIPGHLQH